MRIAQKILEPLWVIVPATIGRDHNQGTIVLEVEERDGVILAGARASRGEQQHVVVDESAAEPSPGQSEKRRVHGGETADIGVLHGARVA